MDYHVLVCLCFCSLRFHVFVFCVFFVWFASFFFVCLFFVSVAFCLQFYVLVQGYTSVAFNRLWASAGMQVCTRVCVLVVHEAQLPQRALFTYAVTVVPQYK